MKPLLLASLCVLAVGPALRTQDTKAEAETPRLAVIVLYDGVELLDFAGPAEVLSHVGVMLKYGDRVALDLVTAAPAKKLIATQNRVTVMPDYALRDCPKADLLVVPGGASDALIEDEAAMKHVRRLAKEAEICFSVCTGAHVLGAIGLLDGRQCTTHWGALASLRRRHPNAKVVGGRVVDAGPVVTAAGVSAGIDGALHLVHRMFGEELATHTARYMEYEWQPPAGRMLESARRAYAEAVASVGRDEFDQALALLERAFEQGQAPAMAVMSDDRLRRMREDPDARLALSGLLKEHARESHVQLVDREESGRRIRLEGIIVDRTSGASLPGVLVQLFHTDHGGEYRPGMDAGGGAGNPRLFGWLRTDDAGRFTVDTIMPERYPDSTVPRHAHYRVWVAGREVFESECFFDSDPNLTDAARRRAPERGFPIVKLERDVTGRAVGALTVRVR